MMPKCSHCETILKAQAKFCTSCGASVKVSTITKRNSSLNIVIVFYSVFLLFALISYLIYTKNEPSLALEIGVESFFAIMVIGFSLLDFKGIVNLYKLPKVDWKIVLFTFVFPVFTAYTVSLAIGYLNENLLELPNDNYYASYLYLNNPLFWAILFTAILPPIFEELAFRGFLFNQLQNVVSEHVTILATAFIFALVHFSFISLIWIFPFGLILGYIRSKYNTLWYGIIIHFIHNFIVLMIDYYDYQSIFTLVQ